MFTKSSSEKITLIIFLISISLLLVHHFYLYGGHYGFDDMEYARLSNDLFNGEFDWENHYSYRLVVLGFTGLCYQLFGISDFTSMLPAMSLTIVIIYLFRKLFKDQPLYFLAVILFYFSFHWNLYYSDKLMPDIYVSAFSFVAWYYYFEIKKHKNKLNRNAILIALFLFLAFNSKGTIILILPLFGYYFLKDILDKKLKDWKHIIATSVALLFIYFGLTYALTGNTTSRFSAIKVNSYLNDCSYDQLGFDHLWERWTAGYMHFLTSEMLIIPFIFSILGLLLYLKYRDYNDLGFYAITSMILLLSVNFMTISISSYSPVCLDPRHILLITPITAVCSVKIVQFAINKFKLNWAIYPILLILLGSFYFYYGPAKSRMDLDYKAIKSDIQFLTKDSQIEGSFYGTPIWKNLSNYYGSFETRKEFAAEELDKLPMSNETSEDLFLIRNYYTEFFAKISEEDIFRIVRKKRYSISEKPMLKSNFKKFRIYTLTPE